MPYVAALHSTGTYRYLPAIPPYSSGVAAEPGHEIIGLRFETPPPVGEAFARLDQECAARGLASTALVGFELRSDTDQGGGKRWVVVGPVGGGGAGLLLAKAAGGRGVGEQGSGRVFLFLETDDFERDHGRMQQAGVHFLETPRREPYGTVVVFEDLYGNRWDLIEPAKT